MTEAPDNQGCPTRTDLETLATGDPSVASHRDHVDRCRRCAALVSSIEADNQLLAKFITANSDQLDLEGNAKQPDIEGYALQDEIHRGAQGVVYRAIQHATKRAVAVKVLAQGAFATDRQLQRFSREVELIADIRHPNIVIVFERGRTADGGHYLAEELVEGKTLDRYLAALVPERTRSEKGAGLRRRLSLFCRVCSAVSAVHKRGIMHRDLKPANILVDPGGEPHVLDFGLAKRSQIDDSTTDTAETMIGEFHGTFAYASPEQVRGDPGEIDIRADVYALGVLLYEMLTGRRPYVLAGSIDQVIDTIERADPDPPSSVNDAIDADVSAIVMKALAKSPGHRYPSAGEFHEDLLRYLSGHTVEARNQSSSYRLRKFLGRHRLPTEAAVIVLAVLAGVLWWSIRTQQRLGGDLELFQEKSSQATAALLEMIDAAMRTDQPEVALRDIDRIITEHISDPELTVVARQRMAKAFRELGGIENLKDAYRQLELALPASDKELIDPVVTASILFDAGMLHQQLRRPASAKQRFRRVIELGDDLMSTKPQLLAQAHVELGVIQRLEGSADLAKLNLLKGIELCERYLGTDAPETQRAREELTKLADR